MNIEYKIGVGSQNEIYIHLLDCDKFFIPKLSEKVNISEYSEKIFNKAINFEAWDNERLIGLVSMYINEEDTSFGYITNVSIINEYKNRGIASNLLKKCIKYSKDINLNWISLKVDTKNVSAVNLYNKFNFMEEKHKNSSSFLKLKLI
ncbi:MAG: GNAT family N-acetyltransferase [Candidatus Lokiarchaeota archaeon]|nr:GNAT family N-acetyltransferase [Candidatus Lokiarchaeota archaeon]